MNHLLRCFAVLLFLVGCSQPFEPLEPESSAGEPVTATMAAPAPWYPNCVGASSLGADTSNGCDDGNPCTQDSIVDGACVHQIEGYGHACTDDGLAACISGQCCPTTLGVCHAEGVQDSCASGSVCLEGVCWIACGPDESACHGTEFPSCVTKSIGSVSARVCQ